MRFAANVQAVRVAKRINSEDRPPGATERAELTLWSGWGALPQALDPQSPQHAPMAGLFGELQELLTADELDAARRSTLNAHYTDPRYVDAVWTALQRFGFDKGSVLEPGCGSGNFIGSAPSGADCIGVELDGVTAEIAQALYPQADIRAESFADTNIAEGSVDLVVGNVPFGNLKLHDKRHNAARHSIHNHFMLKSMHLLREDGVMAVITSRYTLDAQNPAARRELAELGDLLGAVRLPKTMERLGHKFQTSAELPNCSNRRTFLRDRFMPLSPWRTGQGYTLANYRQKFRRTMTMTTINQSTRWAALTCSLFFGAIACGAAPTDDFVDDQFVDDIDEPEADGEKGNKARFVTSIAGVLQDGANVTCAGSERSLINAAEERAYELVGLAWRKVIETYLDRDQLDVAAFEGYFGPLTEDTYLFVGRRYTFIQSMLAGTAHSCHDDEQPFINGETCASKPTANASTAANSNRVRWCLRGLNQSLDNRARTLVHEMAHQDRTGDPTDGHISDTSVNGRHRNAHSYGNFLSTL